MKESFFSKLHDATLKSIDLDFDAIGLQFNIQESKTLTLKLVGVKRFLCDDLREGNVVLHAGLVVDCQLHSSYLDKLYRVSNVRNKENEIFLESVLKK